MTSTQGTVTYIIEVALMPLAVLFSTLQVVATLTAFHQLAVITLHKGAKCHFLVQEILSAGITWKTYSEALKYFIVYLSTGIFAVIEIYSSKLLLESQIQTCFDVFLTQKYQNIYFE